ncbi:ABC transporter permease [Streptomyces cinerochromogenes]|uniref:ABC transporter permease n=1 Tax=Streptomyces cinerochromogenes TaxID=66422 RepID=A0ABW7BG75_9ACTN
MTAALSAPARANTAPRQIRWLLRVHRPALCAWTVLVVGLAATLLWLWGPLTDAAATGWHQYHARCWRLTPCRYDQDAILRYKDLHQYTTVAVLAVPFLAAAWAGAALTGREVETGTARLSWTQTVSPVRWLATRLTVPALLVTAGTGLLALLHHVVWSAGYHRIDSVKPWDDVPTFYSGGPIVAGLALAGLVLGALIGLLLGRSLLALCSSALAVAPLWIAVHMTLPHLWPVATSVSGRRASPSYSGIKVAEGIVTSSGAHQPTSACTVDISPGCQALNDRRGAVGFYTDYHPYSHYWPLQLATTGALLALAALLAGLALWLVRRRTTGGRAGGTAALGGGAGTEAGTGAGAGAAV